MHTYGVGRETLAKIAVKNHYNGARNPKAHLRMEVTEEKVLAAPMISSPFGLFDCCPTTDGGAAAILCRADLARRYTDHPVLVKGFGLAVTGRPSPGLPSTTSASAPPVMQQAYQMAGITAADVDFAEIARLLHLDRAVGASRTSASAPRARARRSCTRRTALGGDIPIEIQRSKVVRPPHQGERRAHDLRVRHAAARPGRRAPDRSPELGLAHNVGGPGAVACVIVLGH
ncbi:MAG: hypothetical protein U0802_14515 [Candidatus Binatia bacterium]